MKNIKRMKDSELKEAISAMYCAGNNKYEYLYHKWICEAELRLREKKRELRKDLFIYMVDFLSLNRNQRRYAVHTYPAHSRWARAACRLANLKLQNDHY